MPSQPSSTRRDPRYELREGTSFVEFPAPASARLGESAALLRVSVAGLAFRTGGLVELEAGEAFKGVTVRVGSCRLTGDLVVRSVVPAEKGGTEIGCLFDPSGRESTERWSGIIAGIEATLVDP